MRDWAPRNFAEATMFMALVICLVLRTPTIFILTSFNEGMRYRPLGIIAFFELKDGVLQAGFEIGVQDFAGNDVV